MTLPTTIVDYLEKQVTLYAKVKPSEPDYHAWIQICPNTQQTSDNLFFGEPEKYIFRWAEVSPIRYDGQQKNLRRGQPETKFKFYDLTDCFQKYVAGEIELETLIRQYLDDLVLLKPHLGEYPFG